MIISLEGEVNTEMLEKLLSSISSLGEEELLIIYLNSFGGYDDTQEAIVHIINQYSDRIKLIASGELYSAAFNIFFRVKCEREVLNYTRGMVHLSSKEMKLNGLGKSNQQADKILMKTMKEYTKANIEYMKGLGISLSSMNKIKRGEDVYFTYLELRELLNNQIN